MGAKLTTPKILNASNNNLVIYNNNYYSHYRLTAINTQISDRYTMSRVYN